MKLPFLSENVDLRGHTYYQMGGQARYFAEPASFAEISQSLEFARTKKIPIAVLGTGSNSIFADGEFLGLVLSLRHLNSWNWETDEMLYVEGGVTNTEIAEIALAAGRDGAAWMFRMPGQLGATVRMNARCYGGEISEIVYQVISIDAHGHIKCRSGVDVFKGYKSTLLMQLPEVVLAARIFLPKLGKESELLKKMLECESDRHSKHHFDHPSCGSTFKNNYAVGKPSGRVFDELGMKGTSVGNSAISLFHANFVWNLGNAKTNDFLTLTAKMRGEAMSRANAALELEVQPIGLFAPHQFEECGMAALGPSFGEKENKWVGLFWHPSQKTELKTPLTLVECPFLNYMREPKKGIFDIVARLEQLMTLSEAQKDPSAPFLKWTCLVDEKSTSEFSLFPNVDDFAFVDDLWTFSVAEVFFSHPKYAPYKEFEITPKGHYIAIEFDGPRKRRKGFETLSAALWKDRGANPFVVSKCEFGFEFSYGILSDLIESKKIASQSMLSLGHSRYFLSPHWKSRESADETFDAEFVAAKAQPDFHQPARFWVTELI